ncbi:alpha,alpha-trehalose-phosphate synthase (UDP-forming) [Pseudofulvimonas gallinarii]|uniref:Trehalose 6-phosphate synthase n=1 Tax=Pseudofulvimonas gallinarii TaxID=634155 RepID=A0A4R3LJC3_9GAMM|nr:trehalose-6-phosphate synthase [Pseudofulvimonas gallinarii]TCT00352.1 trehalose 6-phosphate synthase [Pseudofulvimonas gallinarii]THD14190.1 trehalose-6-phosphate synthase [Pseudofulvimonas gallinarii]
MSRLVVVSNRVGDPRQANTGGLATAMLAALRERGGVWLGWNGRFDDARAGTTQHYSDDGIEFVTFALARRQGQAYYNGFANRVLWPLLHARGDLVDYQREEYSHYQDVNHLFADVLQKRLQPGDTLWIHDYHLLPLAQRLRERGLQQAIGFFLHTPLPGVDQLRALPRHTELIGALAACDLIGVQTDADLHALHDYVTRELGARLLDRESGLYESRGQRFQCDAFPIGIDVDSVQAAAARAPRLPAVQRLRSSMGERQMAIGVDRLDYSKGIPQRFRAFGEFLQRHPQRQRQVSLLQIAPPSRGDVREYRLIRDELNQLAGAINGAWADPDWVPIRYVNKSFAQSTLTGFYRMARVGLVTPFRDGMNLVAKEFIAAQDPADPGVLVLSQMAGAARQLDSALLVNPHDLTGVAHAVETALAMPQAERQQRWTAAMDTLRRHSLEQWRQGFLDRLRDAGAARRATARPAAAKERHGRRRIPAAPG